MGQSVQKTSQGQCRCEAVDDGEFADDIDPLDSVSQCQSVEGSDIWMTPRHRPCLDPPAQCVGPCFEPPAHCTGPCYDQPAHCNVSCGLWRARDKASEEHCRAEVVHSLGSGVPEADVPRDSWGMEIPAARLKKSSAMLDEEVCKCIARGDQVGVQKCLDEGACLEARPRGLTPLQLSVKLNQIPLVQRLLWHNADVNAVEPCTGSTSLFLAASDGRLELCQTLLRARAEPDVVDRMDRTLADIADSKIWPQLQEVIAGACGDHSSKKKKQRKPGLSTCDGL